MIINTKYKISINFLIKSSKFYIDLTLFPIKNIIQLLNIKTLSKTTLKLIYIKSITFRKERSIQRVYIECV